MIALLTNKLFALAGPFFTLVAAASEGGHGESSGGGAPHLPSVVSMLTHHSGPVYDWINVIYALGTSVLMVFFSVIVYANRRMIPGRLQNFMEILVESMYNFVHSILGKEAKRYTPFIGTLFFYILINNFWGIVPGGHSPSTSINITASLAMIVFLYSQYTGITRLGIVKWLDHLAGEPRSVVMWCLVPLLLPIHIIGEFAKPFSLAVRLFGNITGEDVLVAAFVSLGIAVLAFIGSPIGLPLNVPFILLGLLLSTIQALVFAALSTIYLLLMLPHGEEH